MAKKTYASSKLKVRQDRQRWWTLPDNDDAAVAVEDRCRQLWNDDSGRRTEIEANLQRWGLRLIGGMFPDDSPRVADAVRFNLTKSLIETITAKVGKNRPRPMILTDGADFGLKSKAKKLQRFLDGAYQQARVYDAAPLLFRNAMLCGTGVLSVGADHLREQFTVENVFPSEILVDRVESVRGEAHTRSIYRVTFMDKDVLCESYPHAVDKIESAPATTPDGGYVIDNQMDTAARCIRLAAVSMSWRKAGRDASGDMIPGRWCLACNGVWLDGGEWPYDQFPFLFMHWSSPVRGFWGDSAAIEIRGPEKEANVLLQRVQESMRHIGMPIVFAPESANLKRGKLSNIPATVINYDGQVMPSVVTPQPVHPQIIDHAFRLRQVAAEQLGTNELAVSATKPAGVESGRALEQLSEEHAVRFETVSRQLESVIANDLAHAFLVAAQCMDAAVRERTGKPFVLRSRYERQTLAIKWDEACMQPEEFFVDVWPVSVLPHTPSGRTAEVERWQANKWIDDGQAKELLDFPDLESVAADSDRADAELLEWQIEQLLDAGEPVEPEKRQNLDRAIKIATFAKLRATREGAPAERVEMLEEFIASCEDLRAAGMPPAPAMPAAPGAGATAPLAMTGMMGNLAANAAGPAAAATP